METELKVLVIMLGLQMLKWLGGEPLQQRKASHHSQRIVGMLDRVLYILYCCVRIEQQSQTFLPRHVHGCQNNPDNSPVRHVGWTATNKSLLTLSG